MYIFINKYLLYSLHQIPLLKGMNKPRNLASVRNVTANFLSSVILIPVGNRFPGKTQISH